MAQVSVILPTHNRAATLARAIRTVLDQSFADFELIVIDDASTDGTAQLLAAIADPRLRVLRQPERGGAAAARNRGIRAATSEWIAFQDSDDEWQPVKLAAQTAMAAAHPQAGWIGGAYSVDGRVVSSPRLVAGSDYDHDLLVGAPFVTPTWLVRRSVLIEANLFDASLPCLEDWDLIFRLADCCTFRAVPDVVLVRHGSADSLYGDVAKRRVGLEAVLTRHHRRWLQEPARYARWCAELGRLHALLGDFQASRRWLAIAVRTRPWQYRGLGLWLAGQVNRRMLRRLARSRFAVLNP